MADKTYRVTAPLVLAKQVDGPTVYVYRGGALPAGTDPDQVAMLLDEKSIVEGDVTGGLPVDTYHEQGTGEAPKARSRS